MVVKSFGKDRLVFDLTADDFDRLRRHVARTRGPVGAENYEGVEGAQDSSGRAGVLLASKSGATLMPDSMTTAFL
jgi:hypothetical protein